ncbi:MAG: tetratricopeptide repeat protein [Ignavibacteriae bacterium]|nr:tetratricopeptide repeat protein [Ignavibacteriota bacterium]
MSSNVGKILRFVPQQPDKFGFERVQKRKKRPAESPAQLSLFMPGGQVLRLPSDIGPFEEALLLDERDDERAEAAYRRSIEEGDDAADAYCNLGIIMSKRGATTKAFDCFTKSLQHNPRHFESHYNLANLYFEAMDLRLARMHYGVAAEIDSDRASVYFNLGLVEAMANDLPAAIISLKKYQSLVTREESHKADDLLENLQRSIRAQR